MIEKDNIQELFSKAFENHTSPVRPDLWTGVQAKMSAAGVTGGSAAVKGISALTKWIVGTAAVTTIGVTTYFVTNTDKSQIKDIKPVVATTNPASETPIQNQDVPTTGQSAESKPEQKQNIELTVKQPNNKDLAVQLFPADNVAKLIEKSPVMDLSLRTLPQANSGGGVSGTNNSGSASSSQNVNNGTTAPPSTVSNSGDNEATETSNSQLAEAKIEFPNIFTPNGDGQNDYYFLKMENVKTVEITVIDQNNNPIIKSDDLNFKWDGSLPNGDQAREGIFTVLVIYTDMAGKVNTLAKPVYLKH